VVGVAPRQAPLVAALLPERLHELHRLEGALRIEYDSLARGVGLGAAEGPGHGVGEHRRVAEGVAEGLAIGLTLLLQAGEELAGLVPPLGILGGAGPLCAGAHVGPPT